jgi:hypothetical protein
MISARVQDPLASQSSVSIPKQYLHFPFDQLYGLAGLRSKYNSSSAIDTHAQEDNVVVLRIEKAPKIKCFCALCYSCIHTYKPGAVRVQE